jgi:hypothetical protein
MSIFRRISNLFLLSKVGPLYNGRILGAGNAVRLSIHLLTVALGWIALGDTGVEWTARSIFG